MVYCGRRNVLRFLTFVAGVLVLHGCGFGDLPDPDGAPFKCSVDSDCLESYRCENSICAKKEAASVPNCGNGIVDSNEECDDGNDSNEDGCLDTRDGDCREASCGDGYVHTGVEACDDNNKDDGDYCAADCTAVTGECGDGVQQTNEKCDDGNQSINDYCSTDCLAVTGWCGDGVAQGNEACDDSNNADGDYCAPDCLTVTGSCGDGNIQTNETCDDGNIFTEISCDYGIPTCTFCNSTCSAELLLTGEYCGDDTTNGAEACDDGNTTTEASCDYGTPTCTFCSSNCSAELTLVGAYCGDLTINGGEACDGTDFTGQSCASLGEYAGGSLNCNNDCTLDTSACDLQYGYPAAPESGFGTEVGDIIEDLNFELGNAAATEFANRHGSGTTFSLNHLYRENVDKGGNWKAALLFLTTGWVPPGRAETVLLSGDNTVIYEAGGILFIAILLENSSYEPASSEDTEEYSTNYSLEFPTVVGELSSLSQYFPQVGFPQNILIDLENMEIKKKQSGAVTSEDGLAELLAPYGDDAAACDGDESCDANAYCDRMCRPDLGNRESCDRSSQCLSGSCVPIGDGGQAEMCLQECPDDSSICGEASYCDTKNDVFSAPAICWDKSTAGAACLAGALASEGACYYGAGVECVPNGIGMGHECKKVCSGEHVDKQGAAAGCAEDEWCLADQSGTSSQWEFQLDDLGEEVQCVDGGDSNCDQAKKYTCREVSVELEFKKVCVRKSGRCGVKVDTQHVLTEDSLVLGGDLGPDVFCNYLGRGNYCEGFTEAADVSASVECVQLSWGYHLTNSSNQPFSCTTSLECGVRGAECISWSEGPTCGYNASICVSFCESPDGAEEYTCPDDQYCTVPESRVAFVQQKDVQDEAVRCDNNGPCEAGFTCTEFTDGEFCIRFRKVCRPGSACNDLNCGDHGTCADSSGAASCTCETGYVGDQCQNCDTFYEADGEGNCNGPCLDYSCGVGQCGLENGVAKCTCPAVYTGDHCEACAENSAEFNGGCYPCSSLDHCNGHGICAFAENGAYTCSSCHTGYAGEGCESCADGYSDDGNGNCVQ